MSERKSQTTASRLFALRDRIADEVDCPRLYVCNISSVIFRDCECMRTAARHVMSDADLTDLSARGDAALDRLVEIVKEHP